MRFFYIWLYFCLQGSMVQFSRIRVIKISKKHRRSSESLSPLNVFGLPLEAQSMLQSFFDLSGVLHQAFRKDDMYWLVRQIPSFTDPSTYIRMELKIMLKTYTSILCIYVLFPYSTGLLVFNRIQKTTHKSTTEYHGCTNRPNQKPIDCRWS